MFLALESGFAMMDKPQIYQHILARLQDDHDAAQRAAFSAYEAATHEETIAENKFDTLALEASYLAAGQSRRALDIEQALQAMQNLPLKTFDGNSPIQLGALIGLEADNGSQRWLFLGPAAGGLKVQDEDREILVITPESPMGQSLLGKILGDEVTIAVGSSRQQFEIIAVS